MALRLELYSPEHIESVKRLNTRLREGNVEAGFLLPEQAKEEPGGSLDGFPAVPFVKRHFVALEGREVRGAFQLQEQQFEIAGKREWVGNIQMPISEGLVDRKYATIAGRMLRLLLEKRPFVYAVGMGSLEAQFARMLGAMNWRVTLVPFKFYVLRGARFLREIRPLHTTKARSLAANMAAATGLGALAIGAIQKGRALKGGKHARLSGQTVTDWRGWSDAVWTAYEKECSFAAIRDQETLPSFHNLSWPGLIAHRFEDTAGRTRGWAAMQVTAMRGNKYFSDLRVGTLVDAISEPGYEGGAIRAAIESMRRADADLIVCNHTHSKWLSALDSYGFGNGPSNYVLAISPKLKEAIAEADPNFERVHVTRGDGDGRIHL